MLLENPAEVVRIVEPEFVGYSADALVRVGKQLFYLCHMLLMKIKSSYPLRQPPSPTGAARILTEKHYSLRGQHQSVRISIVFLDN